jgi:hypothetical protein
LKLFSNRESEATEQLEPQVPQPHPPPQDKPCRRQLENGAFGILLDLSVCFFCISLDGNAFNQIARHRSLTAIIQPGGSGIGVACQVLYVGQGRALRKQIGDGSDSIMWSTT